jgi:hypothetical protein
MKRIISSVEVVDELEIQPGRVEVCAAEEANFDEATSLMTVQLNAYLRPIDFRAADKHCVANWLPRPETIHEHLAIEEAMPAAKEIFRRWTTKVRRSMPTTVTS